MSSTIRKWFFISLIGSLATGCGSSKRLHTSIKIDASFDFVRKANHFIGLLVVDPVSKDTLYSVNAKKYFTPASTTKIVTFYTALQLLPERIPALKYISRNDTLYFEGTGDPTFLHPYFNDSTALDFLRGYEHLAFHANNYRGDLLGPGWSLEDYQYYYQVERGALPLYGNVVTIHKGDGLQVVPELFRDSIVDLNYHLNREENSNKFYFNPYRKDTLAIPFQTDSALTKGLMEKALKTKISLIQNMPEGEKSIVYGHPTDSVYKKMLQQSDNFLADQLLIVSSSILSDSLDGTKARSYILKNKLSDLNQFPRWVDGSGLSRYNLFTPESMVHILGKLYADIPKDRLFALFPVGGVSGTLKNWYAGKKEPYIYAKSGSLGNNYSLNGYLLTKSGRTLIFSFMNNHFMEPSSGIKTNVQRVLESIRDNF